MKGNPIGTRWDAEFLQEFTAKTGIKSPQKILNFLCEYWNQSKNAPTPSLSVEKPKESKPAVQTSSVVENLVKNAGKVPFEKEKLFFREKYTLHPESSKPAIQAHLTSWKAQKLRSDAEIKKAWEKFQSES